MTDPTASRSTGAPGSSLGRIARFPWWVSLGRPGRLPVPDYVSRTNRTATVAGYVVLAVVAVYPALAGDGELIQQFIPIGIYSLVAIGLNFAIGQAGEFALGQAGTFAAGAYVAAILTAKYGWSYWDAVGFAVVVACVIGLLAGLPGLRLGSWYFALTSLFAAIVILDIATESSIAGGLYGFGNIPFPSIAGHQLSNTQIYLLIVVSVVVTLLLIRNLIRSVWGLAFVSMRESRKGAEGVGISVMRMKVLAYLIASIFAGFAGALYSSVEGFISPGGFPFSLSILFVAGAVVGGLDSLAGPIVGIALLQLLPHEITSFDKYSLLIYGVILIVVMVFIREGLLPAARNRWVQLSLYAGRRWGWVEDRGLADPDPETAGAAADMLPGTNGATNGAGEAGRPDRSKIADRTGNADQASLVVTGVSKHFEGLNALVDVSLEALPGELTAIIGPNGSGKTTLLNIISGYYRVNAGTVCLGERQLSGHRPHMIARAGIGRTFQTPVLIPDRTARENVMAGMFYRRRTPLLAVIAELPRARRDRRAAAAAADDLLQFVGLRDLGDTEASSLTAGQQRLVEIARALATDAQVVLLDEPAAGLVGAEVNVLAAVLKAVRAAGYVVILVEHNINLVMNVANQITVLDAGRVIAQGDPAAIQQDPIVLERYLGEVTADA